MSFSKALCVLCECPTADGAVLAVHVDKDKLQHWALNVCGHQIAHEIDDRDKICYFCLWQAEFLAEHEFVEESLVWWQGNLELDDAALLLRRKYFEGEVEQCWVQLEKIEMPNVETDNAAENVEHPARTKREKCIYCDTILCSVHSLSDHMRRKHKNAIRCEHRKCATYFHTLEEKNKHMEEIHKTKKTFKCQFCADRYKQCSNYRRHVRRMHKEFKFACSFYGCLSYFKSGIELQTHINAFHARNFKMKKFQCNDCGFKTSLKGNLRQHIARKHLPKTITCEKCNRFFASKLDLKMHFGDSHTFKRCKFCSLDVTFKTFRLIHSKLQKCRHCDEKFSCSGLLKLHISTHQKSANWKTVLIDPNLFKDSID